MLSDALKASAAIAWTRRAAARNRRGRGRRAARFSIPATIATVVGAGHRNHARTTRAGPSTIALAEASPKWSAVSPAERAACLERAADLMQARMPTLLGLIVREAGKSLPNAIAEVREAIDFLRYYAEQARPHARTRASRRSGRSSASARGISRWRSSPARSPRRSSPAIRCSPSRPRKRR